MGFSILELIFALVVTAIVYAVALPMMRSGRLSASVHNSKHVVVSTISLARATAMRYGRPAVVRIDAAGDRIWVETDTTLEGTGAALDTLGMFDLAEEFEVDMTSNRGTLCFNGRGIGTTSGVCTEAGATIVLSLHERADTVVVSSLGRVLP
jgi:Tfp pilus assembly protein FimT